MRTTICLAWSFTIAFLNGCGGAVADKGQEIADTQVQQAATPQPVVDKEPLAVTKEPSTLFAQQPPSVFAEDLAHTPPYSYLVAVMRPAKMLELKGVQEIPGMDLAGSNPFKPSEVERVIAAVYPRATDQSLGIGVAVQLRVLVPREKIIARLSPQAEALSEEPRVYVHPEWDPDSLVLGFPDDHTILVSYDPGFVFERVSGASANDLPPHSLAPAFADIDPTAHAAAVADVSKLIHFFQAMLPENATSLIKQIEPFQVANTIKVAVNLSEPDGLVFRTESDSAADAQQLGRVANAALSSKAAELFAMYREVLGDDFAAPIQSVQQRLTTIIEEATLQVNGSSLTIKSNSLPPAADTLKLVADLGAMHLARLRSTAADLNFASDLRLIGLAIHFYHDAYRKLPRDILADDGTPLLSWRVALLPFIQQGDLYDQFRLDESWDSAHNLAILKQNPRVYPTRGKGEPMKTSIQWATGNGTGGAAMSFEEVQGMNQVLALVESAELVPWTQPADFVFNQANPNAKLRPAGSFGLFYDSAVAYLTPTVNIDLLRLAFLNDGNEFDAGPLEYNRSGTSSREVAPVRLSDDQLAKLLSALDSEQEPDIADSLRALGDPQPKSPDARAQVVVDKATQLLDNDSPLIKAYALRAIHAWGRHANVSWPPIAKVLNDPFEANRWLAINLLKDFPEPALVQAMLRLPAQDNAAANAVLSNHYANGAADAAASILSDAEFTVRLQACSLISQTGNESHLAKLQPLLDDPNERVRETAKAAIEQLRTPGPLVAIAKELDGDIAAALEEIASDVEIDDDGNAVAVDLSEFDTPYRLTRGDFQLLGKLTHLKNLKLTYSMLMAADVAHLSSLPLELLEINYCPRLDDNVADSLSGMTTLQSLEIQETNVGDRTAAAIGQLQNLIELDISATRITDKGLAALGKLRRLQSLNLSNTRITDKGLAGLAGLTELRELYLLDTGLTDAAIPHLQTLSGLQFINLTGTELSPEGFARLRAALPDCRGLDSQ